MNTISARQAKRIAVALEQWFAARQRDLPWRRRTRSIQQRAYRCLVAEYMLHQTQVARVLDYFDRFIARFPDVQSLASAPEQDVLALWQGLGYYRRARNLQAAARLIVDEFAGRVPRDVDSLLRLPGVGRYTAGAIASIAFGEPAPIVDGNVQRVVARWLELGEVLTPRELEHRVWSAAETLVRAAGQPGDFNQALMELGSTICLPRGARCGACPAARWCGARASDRVDLYPPVKQRPEPRTIHAASVIVARRGKVLLSRRPATGLWANMWQCPTLESEQKIEAGTIAAHLHQEHGLSAALDPPAGAFVHQTSHRRVMFEVWIARSVRGRVRRAEWVAADKIEAYPLSNAQKRVLEMARGALPCAEHSGRDQTVARA